MEKTTPTILFTKDKPVMVVAVSIILLGLVNLVVTFLRLRSHDFKVPVQYVANDGSVLQTAHWFSLYSLALFSVLGASVIIFLAYRIHKANRVFALGTLMVYLVISVASVLITNALLGLVSKV